MFVEEGDQRPHKKRGDYGADADHAENLRKAHAGQQAERGAHDCIFRRDEAAFTEF